MVLRKVKVIALRELKIRLRKKSFWLTALLGPLVFGLLMIVPLWVTMETKDTKVVVVNGFDHSLVKDLPQLSYIKYIENNKHVSGNIINVFNADVSISRKNTGIDYVSREPDEVLETIFKQALTLGLNKKNILSPDVNVTYIKNTDNGRGIKEAMAYGMSIIVYFFIFMYGVQVMKGVVEEKNNRIIEVMLCTVKPFELMLGKILGISWVGLIQFVVWLTCIVFIESYISSSFSFNAFNDQNLAQFAKAGNVEIAYEVNAYLHIISEINWGLLLFSYLFFFYVGFLLYAAIFAVIGAASDVDTDTQQFIFPLTVPLLGTMLVAQKVISDPGSFISECLSFIPFTTLLATPLRLPFMSEIEGVEWRLVVYMSILFLAFLLITWVASKVYRIGVLSYGKKVNYQDLVRWFFARD